MDTQITISSIIFIVSLIVPGVIFKRFYFQGQFSKQFGAGLFADRIITSIFWGLFVQILNFYFYSRSLGFTFTTIHNSVSKYYQEALTNNMPNLTYKHLGYILGYLISSVVIATLSGTFLHILVRKFKIDVHSSVFRFTNHWHYYFKGEILATKDFRKQQKGKVLSTTVDLLIDVGSGTNKMFTGFLTQYTLSSKTGDLENIYLTSVKRYSNTSRAFKEVPGDCLIVPYSRVIDMNLRYNIQIVPPRVKKDVIGNFISILGFIGIVFCFAFPWFFKIGVIAKIFSVLFLNLGWLLFVAVIYNPFSRNEKLSNKTVAASLLFSLIFLLLTLMIFLNKI